MASDFEQLVEATRSAQTKRPKPPKKAKPIKPNDNAEVYYRKHLRSLVRAMKRSVEQHVMPVLKRVKPEYTADAWDDEIEDALQAAAINFTTQVAMDTYRRLARQVVERTAQQTTASLVKSVEQSVGVDLAPIFNAEPMQNYMDLNIANNVSLIQSIPDQYFKSVRAIIYDGVAGQVMPTTLGERIQQQTGVARRRADLVARDQTSKITGQVNKRRQEQAGIRYFRWVTSKDERVGSDHRAAADRNVGFGRGVYKWDNPPKEGVPGNATRPNCRCTATPVFVWEVEEGDD